MDLPPVFTGLQLDERRVSRETLEALGFREVENPGRCSSSVVTVQPMFGPIPNLPILRMDISKLKPEADPVTTVSEFGKRLSEAFENVHHMVMVDQAIFEAAQLIEGTIQNVNRFNPDIWGLRDLQHALGQLLKDLTFQPPDPDKLDADIRKLQEMAKEFEQRNTPGPEPLFVWDSVAGDQAQLSAAEEASIEDAARQCLSKPEMFPESEYFKDPKVQNSGVSGGVEPGSIPLRTLKDMVKDPVFKDPTQATLLKGGHKPSDLAVVVSGGTPEMAEKLLEHGLTVVEVDPNAESERNNALLTSFVDAMDRATQLGFKLNIEPQAAPAPEQLINWLQEPSTPPEYMQLVMEVLAPDSEIEATDLTERLKEATKIAEIMEPVFNKPDEELDEFELNHLNLWREQTRIKTAKLNKSKAVLGAVAAMMITNSDPVLSSLSRIFTGRRRFSASDKPADPDKVRAQRQQAKDIQMHNYRIDQKRQAKQAAKGLRKSAAQPNTGRKGR